MLIKNGYITDVTDLLKEFGWYDKMDEDMRESITVDGKVYGVPRDGYGLGLFLNLSMLYDIGEIDKNADGTYKLHDDNGNPLYPTTFDDIERISQEVVDSFEQGTYGMIILSANRNGGWQFSNIAWNFGCTNLQVYENGKWTAKLNSQSSVNALEWIRNMRLNDLIYPSASLSYNDWHQKIGNKNVAMAICGSDAVSLPVTNENFNLDDIAFVPMPTGDGTSRYSLYGGTPYVFSSSATEEQIRGAMLFLKYMGRSPEVDQVSLDAIELGYKTAVQKGMPVIPSIRPWVNSNYTTAVAEIEAKYVNVNLEYYNDFFNSINTMKKSEEPNNCQDMYNLLDNALQSVLSNASTANSLSLLTTANNQFQSNYLDKIK
jgi:ABC-type glycerol-3-phosphate transport system substrate-binding protein